MAVFPIEKHMELTKDDDILRTWQRCCTPARLGRTIEGIIRVIDDGWTVFFGGLVGVLAGVPLIWLSWKIPEYLFAAWAGRAHVLWSDPAIRSFSGQDFLFLVVLGLTAAGVVARWGIGIASLMGLCYCSLLLLLALIDARTRLLPDVLTLPLLWLGLVWHAGGADMWVGPWGQLPLEQAVWGAVTGYIVLWLPCVLLQRVLGREMMGYGDFKMSAALGAWVGYASLPYVLLIASSFSLGFAVLANAFARRKLRNPMPFGPGLAMGGILMLFFDGFG